MSRRLLARYRARAPANQNTRVPHRPFTRKHIRSSAVIVIETLPRKELPERNRKLEIRRECSRVLCVCTYLRGQEQVSSPDVVYYTVCSGVYSSACQVCVVVGVFLCSASVFPGSDTHTYLHAALACSSEPTFPALALPISIPTTCTCAIFDHPFYPLLVLLPTFLIPYASATMATLVSELSLL